MAHKTFRALLAAGLMALAANCFLKYLWWTACYGAWAGIPNLAEQWKAAGSRAAFNGWSVIVLEFASVAVLFTLLRWANGTLGGGTSCFRLGRSLNFWNGFVRRNPDLGPTGHPIGALALWKNITVEQAASALGSGAQVSAQDTVPFCLWAAALHLNHYEAAMWATVSGLGDRDPTCAIVGGIVVMSAGVESIPPSWIKAREPMPAWFLHLVLHVCNRQPHRDSILGALR